MQQYMHNDNVTAHTKALLFSICQYGGQQELEAYLS